METTKNKKIPQSQLEQLIKTGIHFGHKKSRWHPSMKPFIHGQHNNIYLIDLEMIEQRLDEAAKVIEALYQKGEEMIFIGTKPNVKNLLKELAEENDLLYITERWIGGTLTNFDIIKKRLRHFKELEQRQQSDEFEKLPKREKWEINKELKSLSKTWEGLKNMIKQPAALFLLDVPGNYLAIKEAKKKGVKIMAVCDTDADIREVDFPIPANDDSLLAIKYILSKVIKAIEAGKARKGKEDDKNPS